MPRGIPKNYVPCTACPSPKGYPKCGLCMRCRNAVAGKARRLYVWTPDKEDILRNAYATGSGNRRQLKRALKDAVARIGFPRGTVKYRAQQLGLTNDTRHPWAQQDFELLREYLGQWSLTRIARKLKRARSAVEAMADRLHLSRRITDGYTAHDVGRLFGVSQDTVARWIRTGVLHRDFETGRIAEISVMAVIRLRTDLYSLKRVDEVLFKALVFAPETETLALKPVRSVQTFAGSEATA